MEAARNETLIPRSTQEKHSEQTEKSSFDLKRYFQWAWGYVKKYFDEPAEAPPSGAKAIEIPLTPEQLAERDRVRAERAVVFERIDAAFQFTTKEDRAIVLQELIGRSITIAGKRYTLKEFLDQGGFGVVFKASLSDSTEPMIIKMTRSFNRDEVGTVETTFTDNKRRNDIGYARSAIIETASLHHLLMEAIRQGKNVSLFPHLYAAQLMPKPGRTNEEPDKRISIQVLEEIVGKNLAKVIHDQKLSVYPDWLLQLTEDLVEAVDQMHAANVYHLDLKPENVMVRQNGHAVVIDFGASNLRQKFKHQRERKQKEPTWSKPVFALTTPGFVTDAEKQSFTPERDVYALGVVLKEMICGYESDMEKFYEAVYPSLDARLQDLFTLVAKMTAENPKRRPTIAQVKAALSNKKFAIHELTVPASILETAAANTMLESNFPQEDVTDIIGPEDVAVSIDDEVIEPYKKAA